MNSQGGKECCTHSTIVCQIIDHMWYMIIIILPSQLAQDVPHTLVVKHDTVQCGVHKCTLKLIFLWHVLISSSLPATLDNFVLVLLAILHKLV